MNEILKDCIDLACRYVGLCGLAAESTTTLQQNPDRPGLGRESYRLRMNRDIAHQRYLDRLHQLEDAGGEELAAMIRLQAHKNALFAEKLATRRAIGSTKEAA